jgi:hypothetical protein
MVQVSSWVFSPPVRKLAAPTEPCRSGAGSAGPGAAHVEAGGRHFAFGVEHVGALHQHFGRQRADRQRRRRHRRAVRQSCWRRLGSSIAVSATSALTSMSHSARWAVARLLPSAALARASAAVAGAWKPALAVSSVRRAVSRRDWRLWPPPATARRRAGCNTGWPFRRPPTRALHASRLGAGQPGLGGIALGAAPPNRSISHAPAAPCEVVPPGSVLCWLARLTLAASSDGSQGGAGRHAFGARLAMRELAEAIVGLAACAASISCASSGSPHAGRHHCAAGASVSAAVVRTRPVPAARRPACHSSSCFSSLSSSGVFLGGGGSACSALMIASSVVDQPLQPGIDRGVVVEQLGADLVDHVARDHHLDTPGRPREGRAADVVIWSFNAQMARITAPAPRAPA